MGSSATSQTIWGFIFIIFGSVSFVGFLYAAVIVKVLPPSDNPFLSYIQRDSSVMKGGGELMKCKNDVDIAAWLAIGNQDASFIYPNIRYYCFLVPLSIPILVVAIYFHWLSMKLFKHA